MPFGFNTTFFYELSLRNPFEIMWILFLKGGWVVFAIMLIQLWWLLRKNRMQGKYLASIDYVMLAIDIPKDSEQTPKAMEQVFATISGAHSPLNQYEIHMKGVVQLSFSFEIISIDGYIQFLIRTPKVHRDLVESAIYAHYPDAEITEVYDYTTGMPRTFPNDRYNLWGSEMQLSANEALPIRTYESFEDKLTQEFKDPLAGVLETMSRIKKGEQVWFQIVVNPTDNANWVARHLAYAYKLAGKKKPASSKKAWYSAFLDPLYTIPDWFPFLRTGEMEKKQELFDFRIMNLTPGERGLIEGVERKASKLGFICKLRLIYISPHELYSSKRVVSSVFGGFKQFGDLTSNSLKPNKRTRTQVAYFNIQNRLNARRGRIIRNYMARSWYSGSKAYLMNTEELATVYHFPSISIVTPFLKRTEAKKSDAPVLLPSGLEVAEAQGEDSLRKQLEGLALDNNYYENLYAKYKTHSEISEKPKMIQTQTEQAQRNDTSIPDNLPIVPS